MTQTLRTLIVDDESLARRGLRLRLQEHPQLELIGEASDGQEALTAVAQLQPDLVLLDIQMPGFNGFDVVRQLQADTMPLIIFVTAFNEYAIDAFNINAIDYVLKPIDDERLDSAIEKALQRHKQTDLASQKQNLVKVFMELTGANAATIEDIAQGAGGAWPEHLCIRDGDETTRVVVADIDWVDAAGDYMCVHAQGTTHIMRSTMKQLEARLNPLQFLRIHRSTIVNAKRITSAAHLDNGEYLLSLHNGTQLKVSRSYRDRIRELTND